MSSRPSKSPRGVLGILVPAIIFLVLAGLTGVVWRQEVSTQRNLLQRHTDDVTLQGARRLSLFVEFRLTAAKLFARRWATHEQYDYSRRRFEEFAQVFISELPGVQAVELIPPDLSGGWWVSGKARRDSPPVSTTTRTLLQTARREGTPTISGPQRAGARLFHVAVVPARRGVEDLGFLLVEFDTAAIIDACFRSRIRSEFRFTVDDGGQRIYVSGDPAPRIGRVRSSSAVPVANRLWTMTVVPIDVQPGRHGWLASLPVPLLGLVLSVTLTLLVHQLSRRMDMYRSARDQAHLEIAQREQAEQALRASEARYRSIFDAASDGFLVLSTEGKIIDANRAAREMHGYTSAELQEMQISQLVMPPGAAETLGMLRILTERGPVRIESAALRREGGTFDVDLRGTQLTYAGSPAILVTVHDVSERKRAVQRHATLARKVLVAQEEERARIARELHDELGQLLTALRLELDWVRKRSARVYQESSVGFDNAYELVEKAAAELRRICRGLRPPLLDDLGVDPAVRLLVNEFKDRTGLAITLELGLGETGATVPPEAALCLYRILQESLTNVSRHSGASKVTIQLGRTSDDLVLTVSDDGKGFDPGEVQGSGSGLAGMRERAILVNGKLSITSERGKGTRVEFRAPLAAPHVKEIG